MFKNDKVLNAQDHVAFHMDKIISVFKPGSKITVVVRPLGSSDGSMDFVMTDDDLNEAIAALEAVSKMPASAESHWATRLGRVDKAQESWALRATSTES